MGTSQAFRVALHIPVIDPAAAQVVSTTSGGDMYTSSWVTTSGISEAPTDGQQYGRQSSGWTVTPGSVTWTTLPGKPATFPPTVPIAKADVGLGNVDDTSDATKNAATATLTNKTLGSPVDVTTIAAPVTPPAGVVRLFAGTAKGLDALAWVNTLGVPLVVTRDRLFYAKNTTGVVLTKGTGVYLSGATGGTPLIAKAQADATMTKAPCVGLVIADIASNSVGAVMTAGVLAMNTSAFADGAKLYLSSTTAGVLTSTMPVHPDITQTVGVVEVSGVGNGSLLVNCLAVNPHEYDGVNGVSWAIGDATGATKSFLVKNAAGIGTLSWNPTANRTLTLPDVTGTVLTTTTLTDIIIDCGVMT